MRLLPRRLSRCLIASALLCISSANAGNVGNSGLPALTQVLVHEHACSPTLQLRTQAFTPALEQQTCAMLAKVEQRFHDLFGTRERPVPHDGNRSLRANIYATRDDFEKYAGAHFAMLVDNGGMYLEGLPDKAGNQAEFVASQKKDGSVRNLEHEYVHYLDGRFNLYGDFCAGLHDSHGGPENCPQPSPLTPYLVWWTEGLGEYLAKGNQYPEALAQAATHRFRFSQLLETGYESNNGVERTYHWGYLAVRFMLERHRPSIEQMLALTRSGDYPRYQALAKLWGTGFDAEFAQWLDGLSQAASVAAK